jgi:hypothetical protein
MYALLMPEKTGLLTESAESVQQWIDAEIEASRVDSRYNGYYDNRNIEYFDVEQTIATISGSQVYFTKEMDLFSEEIVQKIALLQSNMQDVHTLHKITSGQVGASFFEFDHIKYQSKDARQLTHSLDEEIRVQQKWLCNQDKQVFGYYYRLASSQGNSIGYKKAFTDYFALQAEQEKFSGLHHRMQIVQYQLYTKPRWTEEEQRNLVGEISSLHMLFEKYLREANNLSVAVPLDETHGSNSFREYILNEPIAPISTVTFDFDKLRAFISQLVEVISRVVKLNDDYFRRILFLQTGLSNSYQGKVENQLSI